MWPTGSSSSRACGYCGQRSATGVNALRGRVFTHRRCAQAGVHKFGFLWIRVDNFRGVFGLSPFWGVCPLLVPSVSTSCGLRVHPSGAERCAQVCAQVWIVGGCKSAGPELAGEPCPDAERWACRFVARQVHRSVSAAHAMFTVPDPRAGSRSKRVERDPAESFSAQANRSPWVSPPTLASPSGTANYRTVRSPPSDSNHTNTANVC